MIPDTDERLASVVRALTDVILPALPPEAGLAQEQVQLCVGQLQILRAQLDSILAFEAEELTDAVALGEELIGMSDHGGLRSALAAARTAQTPADIRGARNTIHAAIADFVTAPAEHAPSDRNRVHDAVMRAEKRRVVKDRRWFAPFGFDIAPPTAA